MLRSFQSGGGEGENICVEKMLRMKITKYINNIYCYLFYMIYYELSLGNGTILLRAISLLRGKHIIFTHFFDKI